MCKELSRLTQDFQDTKGTNNNVFSTSEQIENIPKGCIVMYERIAIDYSPQKLILTKSESP